MARHAMIAACWSTSEIDPGSANLEFTAVKTTEAMARTRSGLRAGCA